MRHYWFRYLERVPYKYLSVNVVGNVGLSNRFYPLITFRNLRIARSARRTRRRRDECKCTRVPQRNVIKFASIALARTLQLNTNQHGSNLISVRKVRKRLERVRSDGDFVIIQ